MDWESTKIIELRDAIINNLKAWGIDEKHISIKSGHSEDFKRETINAQKDGLFFRVALQAKFSSERRILVFQWDVNFFFFCDNPHHILLTIELKHIKNKIKKWFGKKELKTNNEKFDQAFLINGNSDDAPIDLLDEGLQTKLLNNQQNFTKLAITQNTIQYKEPLGSGIWDNPLKRIEEILDIGLHLAQNLKKWAPPQV